MLGSCPASAFTLTTDPDRAKTFYTNILGLEFVNQDDYALVFNAHGTMLRVSMVPEHPPAQHPVLGWKVPDIAVTVTSLGHSGVAFFKDPDGNVLSLTEG